uniref:Uncharacterized protein n=1 Tax=Candidatus Kentrum sp. MB TaxID=2138164 RepID=A0A450XIX1_9GAMM|nr:MAG: hypothetical protein BECKMB1821G_GA0114241_10473 [Candidatus Kentron sp. MB]
MPAITHFWFRVGFRGQVHSVWGKEPALIYPELRGSKEKGDSSGG